MKRTAAENPQLCGVKTVYIRELSGKRAAQPAAGARPSGERPEVRVVNVLNPRPAE